MHTNGVAIIDQVVRIDRVVHAERRQLVRVRHISQTDVDRTLVWPAAAREVRGPIVRRYQRALVAPVFFGILDLLLFVRVIFVEVDRIRMTILQLCTV